MKKHSNYYFARLVLKLLDVTEKRDMVLQEISITVTEAVITCLEASRFKGIFVKDFIEFKRYVEIYENQLKEKGQQLKEDIGPTSHKETIEDDGLHIFISAGWIEGNSIDEITGRQLQQCVDQRYKHETDGEQLYLLDEAVKEVFMRM